MTEENIAGLEPLRLITAVPAMLGQGLDSLYTVSLVPSAARTEKGDGR